MAGAAVAKPYLPTVEPQALGLFAHHAALSSENPVYGLMISDIMHGVACSINQDVFIV